MKVTVLQRVLFILLIVLLASCSDDPPPPSPAVPTPQPEQPPPPAPPQTIKSLSLAAANWEFSVEEVKNQTRKVFIKAGLPDQLAQKLEQSIDGELADAFATDIDGNGSPELLLWIRGDGSAAQAELIGWEFGTGSNRSLSWPALTGDNAVGYYGRDQLGIQNGQLVRTFPVYRDQDDLAKPTSGFYRVIHYRLEPSTDQSSPRSLVIEKTSLEPTDEMAMR